MTRTYCLDTIRETSEPAASARVTEMLQEYIRRRSHPKVTVTLAKVTVTVASSGEIPWQARMPSLISDVRGHVQLQVTELGKKAGIPERGIWKSENYSWKAGMCKTMNSLAGYVRHGGREN